MLVFQRIRLASYLNGFGQVDKSLSRLCRGKWNRSILSKLFVEELGGTISVTKCKLMKKITFKVIIPTTPNVNGMCDIKYENENRKILEMLDIEFSDIYFQITKLAELLRITSQA